MLFAPINTATSGANTIVSAIVGRKIRVCNYVMVSAGTVTATWQSSGGTGLSGAMTMATGTPISSGCDSNSMMNGQGQFETNTGEGLVLNLGSSVQVSGHISYLVVN
jgi:hypothetical protein